MAKKKNKDTHTQWLEDEYQAGARDASILAATGLSRRFLRRFVLHLGLSRKVKHNVDHQYCAGLNNTLFGNNEDGRED